MKKLFFLLVIALATLSVNKAHSQTLSDVAIVTMNVQNTSTSHVGIEYYIYDANGYEMANNGMSIPPHGNEFTMGREYLDYNESYILNVRYFVYGSNMQPGPTKSVFKIFTPQNGSLIKLHYNAQNEMVVTQTRVLKK